MASRWKKFLAPLSFASFIIFAVYFVSINTTNTDTLRIIDVHEHIMTINDTDTFRLVEMMNELKISKMVLLDTPSVLFGENTSKFEKYDENVQHLLRMKQLFPDRFLIHYTFPDSDVRGPEKFAALVPKGVDGLKFYYGDLRGSLNSSVMYAAYEKAREFNKPVIIHVESQEESQWQQFEQVLNDFPDVIFICPHLCAVDTHLEILEDLLARHGNLYTDAGPWTRVGVHATADPERYRDFFIKHSDRIMFAVDLVTDHYRDDMASYYKCQMNLLEKSKFTCEILKGAFVGLNLPKEALDNIYWKTAKKVYNLN